MAAPCVGREAGASGKAQGGRAGAHIQRGHSGRDGVRRGGAELEGPGAGADVADEERSRGGLLGRGGLKGEDVREVQAGLPRTGRGGARDVRPWGLWGRTVSADRAAHAAAEEK